MLTLPVRLARASGLMAGVSLFAFGSTVAAQEADPRPLDVVVSANRVEQSIQKAGSAVTIVKAEDIARTGARTLTDALRDVPGLDIQQQGGPAGLSNASLRGSKPSQVLVLIDGVRVGDPSGIAGEFDFGAILATDIERIEVLRGPQSALYGSDAMGGVVNIITRKGKGAPKITSTTEAGSYGTISSRTTVSGASDNLSYAFGFGALHTHGYSAYGDRIRRITSTAPRKLERDPADKYGASGRLVWNAGEGVTLEAGVAAYWARSRLDNPGAWWGFAGKDNRLDRSQQTTLEGHVKATQELFGGQYKHSLTAFGSLTDRKTSQLQSCYDAFWASYDCRFNYRGARVGAEYQGDLKLGAYGLLIFGARSEQEGAKTSEDWFATTPMAHPRIDKTQTTNSAFALHQMTLGERLHVSLGGRVDSVIGGQTFPTWRATAAYDLHETGTKLRASLGTGAKAPSLFQRYSQWGTPGLQAEHNFGVDAGIDQSIGGSVKLSATAFANRYSNLIDFKYAGCPGQPNGCYYNVGRATTSGVEFAADAILVPGEWKARASYTYQHAEDEKTHLSILRRPRNKGSASLIYSGIDKLEIEGRATFVGSRADIQNDWPYARVRMPAYAKFDMRADYKINDTFTVFARVENLTNARYEEIRDYATPGRSFYLGLKTVW
jgi:vitamin B12 transporter